MKLVVDFLSNYIIKDGIARDVPLTQGDVEHISWDEETETGIITYRDKTRDRDVFHNTHELGPYLSAWEAWKPPAPPPLPDPTEFVPIPAKEPETEFEAIPIPESAFPKGPILPDTPKPYDT